MTEYTLGTPLRTDAEVGEGEILPAGTGITETDEKTSEPYNTIQCAVIIANGRKYRVLHADLTAARKDARPVEG